MGKISFTNNTLGFGTYGGGLFAMLDSDLRFEGDSTFLHNSAGVGGGGIHLEVHSPLMALVCLNITLH